MIVKLSGLYLIVALAVLTVGCSSSTDIDSNKITNFSTGQELYISKCTACHRAYERESHSLQEWDKILNDMEKKVKLTSAEKATILNYLSDRN